MPEGPRLSRQTVRSATVMIFRSSSSGSEISVKAGCQAESQEETETVRTLRESTRSSSTYWRAVSSQGGL